MKTARENYYDLGHLTKKINYSSLQDLNYIMLGDVEDTVSALFDDNVNLNNKNDKKN